VVKEVRLRSQDVFGLPLGQNILMEWNEEEQPVGKAAGLLGSFETRTFETIIDPSQVYVSQCCYYIFHSNYSN
jgi:hypothetical protein